MDDIMDNLQNYSYVRYLNSVLWSRVYTEEWNNSLLLDSL